VWTLERAATVVARALAYDVSSVRIGRLALLPPAVYDVQLTSQKVLSLRHSPLHHATSHTLTVAPKITPAVLLSCREDGPPSVDCSVSLLPLVASHRKPHAHTHTDIRRAPCAA